MRSGVSGLASNRSAAMRVSWMCSLLLQAKTGEVKQPTHKRVRKTRRIRVIINQHSKRNKSTGQVRPVVSEFTFASQNRVSSQSAAPPAQCEQAAKPRQR